MGDEHKFEISNVGAERALIGALLCDGSQMRKVMQIGLKPEHFSVTKYGNVFRAMSELYDEGDGIDAVTVTDRMVMRGYVEDMREAVLTVAECSAGDFHTRLAQSYAKIVFELAWRRSLIDKASLLVRLAHNGEMQIADIAREAVDIVTKGDFQRVVSAFSAKELFGSFVEDMSERAEGADDSIPTGIPELDELFDGTFRLGEYTIIQGLANIGKTVFMLQLAIAASERVPVIYFTFEGLARDVRDRMVAIRAGVPLREIMRGRFSGDNAIRARDAAQWLAGRDIEIVDSVVGVREMRGYVEEAIVRFGYRRPMVFVDNLNNIAEHMRGKPYDNLTYVSASLLDMVRRLGIGVVASAQQNNMYDPQSGVQTNSRLLMPSMRTIEGARKLAQHPHNMYGLYSPDYIAERIARSNWPDPHCPAGHVMVVNCRQRNAHGPDSVIIKWNKDVPRYESRNSAPQKSSGGDSFGSSSGTALRSGGARPVPDDDGGGSAAVADDVSSQPVLLECKEVGSKRRVQYRPAPRDVVADRGKDEGCVPAMGRGISGSGGHTFPQEPARSASAGAVSGNGRATVVGHGAQGGNSGKPTGVPLAGNKPSNEARSKEDGSASGGGVPP